MEDRVAETESKVCLETILNPLFEWMPQSSWFDRILVWCDLVGIIVAAQIDITNAA